MCTYALRQSLKAIPTEMSITPRGGIIGVTLRLTRPSRMSAHGPSQAYRRARQIIRGWGEADVQRTSSERPRLTRSGPAFADALRLTGNLSNTSRLHGPTLLTLATGFRRGELLALTWTNVDLGKAIITVCQSLQQTNGGVSVKEPKSGRGRQLALPALAFLALPFLFLKKKKKKKKK